MDENSPKSRLAATLLAAFLGIFGIHRLYLEKTVTAVVMLTMGVSGLLTFWYLEQGFGDERGFIPLIAVGIWAFVDFILAVSGKMRDKDGKLVKKWRNPQTQAPED
jgi:TM2 domain-containing membrane protein YozV